MTATPQEVPEGGTTVEAILVKHGTAFDVYGITPRGIIHPPVSDGVREVLEPVAREGYTLVRVVLTSLDGTTDASFGQVEILGDPNPSHVEQIERMEDGR